MSVKTILVTFVKLTGNYLPKNFSTLFQKQRVPGQQRALCVVPARRRRLAGGRPAGHRRTDVWFYPLLASRCPSVVASAHASRISVRTRSERRKTVLFTIYIYIYIYYFGFVVRARVCVCVCVYRRVRFRSRTFQTCTGLVASADRLPANNNNFNFNKNILISN